VGGGRKKNQYKSLHEGVFGAEGKGKKKISSTLRGKGLIIEGGGSLRGCKERKGISPHYPEEAFFSAR